MFVLKLSDYYWFLGDSRDKGEWQEEEKDGALAGPVLSPMPRDRVLVSPSWEGRHPDVRRRKGRGAGHFILSLYTCSQFRPFSHPSVLR